MKVETFPATSLRLSLNALNLGHESHRGLTYLDVTVAVVGAVQHVERDRAYRATECAGDRTPCVGTVLHVREDAFRTQRLRLHGPRLAHSSANSFHNQLDEEKQHNGHCDLLSCLSDESIGLTPGFHDSVRHTAAPGLRTPVPVPAA